MPDLSNIRSTPRLNPSGMPSKIDHLSGSMLYDEVPVAQSVLAEDINSIEVDNVRHQFYEKDRDFVVVRLLIPSSTLVGGKFNEDGFEIKFQTGDQSFHAAHGGNDSSVYIWKTELAEKIVPHMSSSRCQNMIELSLKKTNVLKKWSTLTPKSLAVSQSSDILVPLSQRVPLPQMSPVAVKQRISASTASSSTVHESEDASESPSSSKPLCKVEPFVDQGMVVRPGFTGLRNMGNTCFLNSVLQILINTEELKAYFLNEYFLTEINPTNPLGMAGKLAKAFAELMQDMWNGMVTIYEPYSLKSLVASKAIQFANFAQHDAQEFLSFLLDGLHEDLNRVRDKPLTKTVESDGREDQVVAEEAWQTHRLRNDSIIVDLFHGQYKSRLECPSCSRISITFDPFVYLAVPFPKSQKVMSVYYFTNSSKPIKYSIVAREDSTFEDLYIQVAQKRNCDPKFLIAADVFDRKIWRIFCPKDSLWQAAGQDLIFVFDRLNPSQSGEEVVNVWIIQRLLVPRDVLPNKCESCNQSGSDLRVCTRCYSVVYCNEHTIDLFQFPQPSSSDSVEAPDDSIPQSPTSSDSGVDVESVTPKGSEILLETANGDSDSDNVTSPPPMTTPASSAWSRKNSASKLQPVRLVIGDFKKQRPLQKLFYLCKTNSHGDVLKGIAGYPMKAPSDPDSPLDLKDDEFLAMDWRNKRGSADYLQIQKKQTSSNIDLDFQDGNDKKTNDDLSRLSLYKMLDLFTEKEVLKAQDAWYCDRCKTHQEATKKLSLWRLPPLLVIQLKRFAYGNYGVRNKIEKTVHYPVKSLDMRDYLCAGGLDENPCTEYDLYGVVCHMGTSYFGHYISHARCFGDDSSKQIHGWRLFDDSHVTSVNENQVVSKDAYLLFYRRKDISTSQLLARYSRAREIRDYSLELDRCEDIQMDSPSSEKPEDEPMDGYCTPTSVDNESFGTPSDSSMETLTGNEPFGRYQRDQSLVEDEEEGEIQVNFDE